MNYSKISYEQVLSLAEQLKTASVNMESVLTEITTLLNRVGNSDAWNGTSAAAAKMKFDTLAAKLPEFYNATRNCHTHLVSVVENYKNVDASISNG